MEAEEEEGDDDGAPAAAAPAPAAPPTFPPYPSHMPITLPPRAPSGLPEESGVKTESGTDAASMLHGPPPSFPPQPFPDGAGYPHYDHQSFASFYGGPTPPRGPAPPSDAWAHQRPPTFMMPHGDYSAYVAAALQRQGSGEGDHAPPGYPYLSFPGGIVGPMTSFQHRPFAPYGMRGGAFPGTIRGMNPSFDPRVDGSSPAAAQGQFAYRPDGPSGSGSGSGERK